MIFYLLSDLQGMFDLLEPPRIKISSVPPKIQKKNEIQFNGININEMAIGASINGMTVV